MTVNEAYLTTLYAVALSGKPCDELPPEKHREGVAALAKKHGIAGALYPALKDTEMASYFEEAYNAAVENNALRQGEEERVFTALDKADISYLPLKDSVLRLYYPSAEMREGTETDLMVDSYARKSARAAFEACGYKLKSTVDNSDIFAGESGKTFALHFKPDDASDFHRRLMERAIPVCEQANRHSLSYSDFYIYLISDTARLFKSGKASLSTLGDVKVFYSRCGAKLEGEYVEKALDEMGLLTFEKAIKKLIFVLFYGEKGDYTTTGFANCIFALDTKLSKEQKKEKKELFVKLGIAYSKNGKQRMSGSDIALSLIVILVLIFAIGFISTAFFQQGGARFDPPEFSAEQESSAEDNSGDFSYDIPEQNYATIPFRNGVYVGYVADGLPNGSGTLSLPNGEKYRGGFENGMFHGKGKYYYLNGSTYDGIWFEGEMNGEGTLTFADGSYIYGDFINGTPEGVCEYQNANGDVYEGELKDGKRTGKGRFSWVNGDVYEGDYVDGRREGYGKYTHCNGDVYEGEWVDSVPNGEGTMTTQKATLTGVFIQGILEGEGKSVAKNGDVCEGYFIHGKCNDENAVYTFKDGSKYEGAIVDDKFNGKGKFTYADGDTVSGTFEDGLLQGSAVYYDKSTGRTRYITYKDGKPV